MSATSAAIEAIGPDDWLNEEQRAAVLALAAEVRTADGVAALSEGFELALDRPGRHVLAIGSAGAGGESVIAYAGVADDGSAELFVGPGSRRQGLGRRVWASAKTLGAQRIWAHGDLDPAKACAAAEGLERVRELHLMTRPLTQGDRAESVLPQGFTSRTFDPAADGPAWVDLNATAFAHHPEQGQITLADLRSRIELPWFDPAGFFLVEDDSHPDLGPIAFHWTKIEPGAGPQDSGEVYVVGVHPAYQGRGLARPLTRLGIAHLARHGLGRVDLYVDGDNTAALATYRKEGFTITSTDVVYALPAARMGS